MDYTDSIQILTCMRKNQTLENPVWRSKTLLNRAEKVRNQSVIARHFCRSFDDNTGEGLFDRIVSHFIE